MVKNIKKNRSKKNRSKKMKRGGFFNSNATTQPTPVQGQDPSFLDNIGNQTSSWFGNIKNKIGSTTGSLFGPTQPTQPTSYVQPTQSTQPTSYGQSTQPTRYGGKTRSKSKRSKRSKSKRTRRH